MTTLQLAIFTVTLLVALYGHISYLLEIPRRTVRPKAITWLIWGILGTCVAVVQLRHGAGLGAIGAITGAVSGYALAATSWIYGHRHIHGSDILSLALAGVALLCWGIFGDTVAVIVATIVYLIGFIPSIVRAWKAPRNERLTPFVTAWLKYALSLLILQSFSVETVVYPAILSIANLLFVIFLIVRRKIAPKPKKSKKQRARRN